ncbi:MAG: sigma-E factor regulatory protein RseB domain-containing protein [Elusimicrobiota bacterium]
MSAASQVRAARRLQKPEIAQALRLSLKGSNEPYKGAIKISSRIEPAAKRGRRTKAIVMNVFWADPSRYRREVIGRAGNIRQIIVADGKNELIYDVNAKRAWRGVPFNGSDKDIESQVNLISESYAVNLRPGRRVAERPTWIITLRSRNNGKVARRLWLDRNHWLILKNEIFRPDGKIGSSMRFTDVSYDSSLSPDLFKLNLPQDVRVVSRRFPDKNAGKPSESSMPGESLPAWLPSGYVFENQEVIKSGESPITHFRFSDGMNVLSLFRCSGRMRLDLGAKKDSPIALGSTPGTLSWTDDGLILSWKKDGRRYVLIGPLALETMERVAESVP